MARVLFVMGLVGCLSVGNTSAGADQEKDWIPLFDGKSLDGWRQLGGSAKYTVEEGEIVGTSVPRTSNSFLCTEKNYSDFVLELEFKVHPVLNSGIQIRSNSLPGYHNGRVHGYQVEIDPSDRGWSGGIYDEGRRGWLDSLEKKSAARYAFRQNAWNHYRIVATGNSIKTWINGVPAADLDDSMTSSGFIGLQVHGVGDRQEPLSVRWRNIRIQDLAVPVVPEGAKIRKLSDGYQFTEGPAASVDGRVFFTDIPNQRIHVFDPKTGKTAIHRENTGRANGLMFAPSGALYACQGGGRQLTRQTDDTVTVLADRYDGKRFNSPNDLVFDGKGGVYFTDPRYGSRDDMEMEIEGVYYLPRNGKLVRVIDDLVRPNGLILSLDKSKLYVADEPTKVIMAYKVQKDGTLSGGQVFARLDPDSGGGGDGMTLDARGNVYCAAQGHIWIWDPAGQQITKVPVPESPANCSFGGAEHKTLFITARTGFYAIDLNVAGVLP